MTGKRGPLDVRFWEKVKKTDSCWIWTAGTNGVGYGMIRGGGKMRRLLAHRVSWELHRGPIPEGMNVLHRCDNPPCTNPEHLFLGTIADNVRDMFEKGRAGRDAEWLEKVKYSAKKRRKLTERQENEVRRLHSMNVSIHALSRVFELDRNGIKRILKS